MIELGTELYSPCKEAYAMLKEAVVGGQSVVFKRYHEAGVTLYKTALFYKPKVCKRIISYDTNVLYLSTICREKCLAGRKSHLLSTSGRRRAYAYRTGEKWNMVRV